MKKISVLVLWLFAAVLCISSLTRVAMAAESLQARLSATTIGFGDTVTLTLSTDADSVKINPDLSPLQQDFDMLSQSTSSQTSVINGARSATISWIITLAPKSMGNLEIPKISAGTVTSNPLRLEVVEAASLPAGTAASQDIAIEVLVDDKPHYVHGEIPITVRIIDGTGLTEASLQAPSGSNFTMRQTGTDDINQSQKNGQPVSIMQRHYLLTPLKSGELTLPPVVLQGTVPAPTNEHSLFPRPALPSAFARSSLGASMFDQMFNPGKQVRVQSTPVALDIKANPVSDSNWFLPAKEVKLSAEWSQKNPTFKVGEAVSRTIRLLALGAAREKLPKLEFADADGARIYLDRSDDKSVDTAQGTAAIREYSVSIVPTRAGEITLPAIDVSWWDTEADEQRIASLPVESISVVGEPVDTVTQANTLVQQHTSNAITHDEAVQTPSTLNSISSGRDYGSLLFWSGLALVGLITGSLLFLRYRRRAVSLSPESSASTGLHSSKRHQQQALKHRQRCVIDACKANQPESAYAAFRAWYAEAIPDSMLSTPSLQKYNTALAREFDTLESRLYQPIESGTWQGDAFLIAFQKMSSQISKHSRNKHTVASVPELYPAH